MDATLRLREPIAPQLVAALRQGIAEMLLRPGDVLSEKEIAARFGVSRQPVREAFIKLAEVGLVEIRPQRGTFVVLISRKEVENARFIREAVEVALARRASAEAAPEVISRMRRSLASQREAHERGDIAWFLREDEAFHQAIALGVDCERAWRLLENLKAQMDRVRYLSMPLATPVETLIEQHEAILRAIEEHAPDRAEAAMRSHLSEILKSLPKIAAAHPDLFVE
jgi:GntR family transcriptional regulator, rspAB operon transcriptional repressor